MINKIKALIALVAEAFQRKKDSATKQNVTVIGDNNITIIIKTDRQ